VSTSYVSSEYLAVIFFSFLIIVLLLFKTCTDYAGVVYWVDLRGLDYELMRVSRTLISHTLLKTSNLAPPLRPLFLTRGTSNERLAMGAWT